MFWKKNKKYLKKYSIKLTKAVESMWDNAKAKHKTMQGLIYFNVIYLFEFMCRLKFRIKGW